VERAQLSEGSRIRIGRVLLVFHFGTQASIGSRPRPDAPRDVFGLMESFLDQIQTGVILFRPGEGLLAMNRAARLMFPAGAEGAPGLRALLRVGRRGDRQEVRSLARGGGRPPVVATRIRLAEQACAIVLFDPELAAERAAEEAQALFGLTRAEAAVVGALLRGRTLREAAAELGVAVNTVRAQLQSVFQKTDVRRQADLVRLLLAAAPGVGLVTSQG
jgi:DNA-binding CsgD family transcriptional regulator